MALKKRLLAILISVFVSSAFAQIKEKSALFISRTAEQSFTHKYTGGWTHFVGGGVATFDCNGDKLPDLYVAGGESPAQLLVNRSTRSGAIRFEPKPHKNTNLKAVIGAYPIDMDGDNLLDLVVLRVGENILLKGEGDCRFKRANELWAYNGGDQWTTAFSATWETGSTGPTLAFGRYIDRKNEKGPFGACDSNSLVRFSEGKLAKPVILHPGYCALSMLFSDWRHNGQADLRISNDRHYYGQNGEEQLWRLQEFPTLYKKTDGWQSFKIWGMGIASRDLTGDGLPEYLLSSMSDQKFHILDSNTNATQPPKPIYRDEAYSRGMTAHRPYFGNNDKPSTAWHAVFGDVNNDGLDDLFIAKGNVDQMPDAAMEDPNNLLIQNTGGVFVEQGKQANIADTEKSRGAALLDLNSDGRLDLVVVNRQEKLQIYENITPQSGNWISIDIAQENSNTNAVGAWIELRAGDITHFREITIGGGHAGGSLGPSHFGVGAEKNIRFRITWPDQVLSDWFESESNQALTIKRQPSL